MEIVREITDDQTLTWHPFKCLGCGKDLGLWENGGEGDSVTCCQREYTFWSPPTPSFIMAYKEGELD